MSPLPRKKAKPRKGATGASSKPVAASDDRVDIDYEQLKSLTRLIQLTGITLVDGGINSHLDPRTLASNAGEKGYALTLGDARWWVDGATLDVLLGYRVTGTVTLDGQRTDLFTVAGRFLVNYVFPDGTSVPHDNRDNLLADLVAANGQINVFPYLRQLVSDLTARAGWPPLVLNVLKAPARRPRGLVRMAKVWESSAEERRPTSSSVQTG